MATESNEFRNRLLSAQEMKPALRDAFHNEVQAMLNPPLTWRMRLPGMLLLILLLACIAGILRAAFFYHPQPLILTAWIALLAAFSWVSILIVRDLLRGRFSRKSYFSIPQILTAAAGTLTVIVLILGLRAPSDPKSTFDALYVFVFYFACAIWALQVNIESASLARREESLRIECRLADLAERLGK